MLDPQGLFTAEERVKVEELLDPQKLFLPEEKEKLWGSPAFEKSVGYQYARDRSQVGPETLESWTRPFKVGKEALLGLTKDTLIGSGLRAVGLGVPPSSPVPETPEDIVSQAGEFDPIAFMGGGLSSKAGKVASVVTKVEEPLDVGSKVLRDMQSGGGFTTSARGRIAKIKEGTKRIVGDIGPVSPKTAFKLDNTGKGNEIYRILDLTDQAINRFLVKETNAFLKAAGGIKAGSKQAGRVGEVLDGKVPKSVLNGQETKLYNHLKKNFDFMYNELAKRGASSPEAYRKMAYAASKDFPPMIKKTALDKDAMVEYAKVRLRQETLKGSRKLAQLTKDELKKYNKYRKKLSGIQHQGWRKTQTKQDLATYDMLKKKISEYLPHIFDQDHLRQVMKDEIIRLTTKLNKASDVKTVNKLKKRLGVLEDSINTMEGGGIVKYSNLPQEFRFKFLDARKGAKGYSFDAMKAYDTYLHGYAKKFYGDPALKQVGELYKAMEPAMKPYGEWFIKNWAGLNKRRSIDKIAGAITSFQWMIKMGLNPRSAITNFTQRLNTIAEAGEVASAKGWGKGWTREGKELFAKSGLAQEVPTVLLEGHVPESMERIRKLFGFMFTKVELGNRKHSFLTGYMKAKKAGSSEEAAMQAGIDLTHKTQFRYGKIGTPRPLSGAVGRVVFQFSSYPIKQIEFLVGMARKNPLKLVKLLAYAEGGNEFILKDFLGVDLSNALGTGMNYGELVKGLQELSEGEFRKAYRHMRLGFASGSGLLPTGPGPTLDTMLKWSEAIDRGEGGKTLLKDLNFVQFNKMLQAYEGIKEGRPGAYPLFTGSGDMKVELTGPELFVETFGPKLAKTSKEHKESSADRAAKKEFEQIKKEIIQLRKKGKDEEADKLEDKYPLAVPSEQALENAQFRRMFPAKFRRMLEEGGAADYSRENR